MVTVPPRPQIPPPSSPADAVLPVIVLLLTVSVPPEK